jgi:hypothetical protein
MPAAVITGASSTTRFPAARIDAVRRGGAAGLHAAHRLRMTAHDLGSRGGVAVKAACYGTAWLLLLVAAGALIAI